MSFRTPQERDFQFVLDALKTHLRVTCEWEAEKRDQFEERWPKVQAVLSALEEFDIYMVDVSPSNIAFAD